MNHWLFVEVVKAFHWQTFVQYSSYIFCGYAVLGFNSVRVPICVLWGLTPGLQVSILWSF